MTDKLIRLSDALALFKLPYQLLAKFEVEALPAVTVGVKPLGADGVKIHPQDILNAAWRDDLGEEGLAMYDRILAALETVAAPDLTDPVTVHANMLRGTIAKPTVEQIIHLYGVDALTKALAPVIVREAGIEPVAAPDPAAIREAALREAAALMEVAAENCRKQFTHPPKTKEQRDYQTGAIIHSNAAAAILALIPKGTADDRA